MNCPFWLLSICGVAAVTATADVAPGQEKVPWNVPSRSFRLDFASKYPKPQVAFLDEGRALEIPVDFLIVKHERVTVEASLPEPGQFDVEQTNPRAPVEIVRIGPRKVDVVAKVSALSATDATNRAREEFRQMGEAIRKELRPQAKELSEAQLRDFVQKHGGRVPGKGQGIEPLRQAYVDVRTTEELGSKIRRWLEALAAEKPKWVSDADRGAWKTAEPAALFDDYAHLLPYQILDEYLHRVGLRFESNVTRFQAELESRARAVYLVLTGNAGWYTGDPDDALKALDVNDRENLRATLTVNLRCRFFPEVDPKDPNAQWYNAQRLAARAQGVRSIRVEGKLDPAAHDRVDWWFVEQYNPEVIAFNVKKGSGFRVEPPYACEGGTRLRVVATGKGQADYTFEFRASASSSADQEIVVYESPSLPGAKFPF
jgi:hypothetical protein